MAALIKRSFFKSAQEHILTCDKHDLRKDIICEDCYNFICSQCAKTVHKEHEWKTIFTGSLGRRKLKRL